MKHSFVLMTAVASSLLVGCAAPRQSVVNYGHPALNQAVPVQNNPGKVAAGALVGGLVGSRFGGGDGRVAAAAAVGAATGAMVAQGGYSNEAAGGALLGGLVGSRFGQGNGRIGAALAGAGLGAWMAVPRE